MLTVCTRTHPGNVRSINEDSWLWEPDIATIAVADGMGGHNAGEVASQMALDTIKAFLTKSAATDDFTWPFGFNQALSFAANRLTTAIKVANRRVFRASEERSEYTGMGTTVVAAIVEEGRLTFAGVGDSRIYSFADGQLTQITKDDSWVVMLMKESGLDASAFEKHPMRHVLTSVVGARPELDVAVEEIDLVDGQTLLFCSDGLTGGMSDHDITQVLRTEHDLERAAERLVTLGVERDGKDNVTVALGRYSSGA
jgi:protein phosphatase